MVCDTCWYRDDGFGRSNCVTCSVDDGKDVTHRTGTPIGGGNDDDDDTKGFQKGDFKVKSSVEIATKFWQASDIVWSPWTWSLSTFMHLAVARGHWFMVRSLPVVSMWSPSPPTYDLYNDEGKVRTRDPYDKWMPYRDANRYMVGESLIHAAATCGDIRIMKYVLAHHQYHQYASVVYQTKAPNRMRTNSRWGQVVLKGAIKTAIEDGIAIRDNEFEHDRTWASLLYWFDEMGLNRRDSIMDIRRTVLSSACAYGREDMVKWLLRVGGVALTHAAIAEAVQIRHTIPGVNVIRILLCSHASFFPSFWHAATEYGSYPDHPRLAAALPSSLPTAVASSDYEWVWNCVRSHRLAFLMSSSRAASRTNCAAYQQFFKSSLFERNIVNIIFEMAEFAHVPVKASILAEQKEKEKTKVAVSPWQEYVGRYLKVLNQTTNDNGFLIFCLHENRPVDSHLHLNYPMVL
jgi:hypothetical protein